LHWFPQFSTLEEQKIKHCKGLSFFSSKPALCFFFGTVPADFLEAYGLVVVLFIICSGITQTHTYNSEKTKRMRKKSFPCVQHTKWYRLTSSRLIHKINTTDREISFKNNSSILEHSFTNLIEKKNPYTPKNSVSTSPFLRRSGFKVTSLLLWRNSLAPAHAITWWWRSFHVCQLLVGSDPQRSQGSSRPLQTWPAQNPTIQGTKPVYTLTVPLHGPLRNLQEEPAAADKPPTFQNTCWKFLSISVQILLLFCYATFFFFKWSPCL